MINLAASFFVWKLDHNAKQTKMLHKIPRMSKLAFTVSGQLQGAPTTKLLMGTVFGVALSLVIIAGRYAQSLLIGLTLAFCGGYIDAYTYVLREHSLVAGQCLSAKLWEKKNPFQASIPFLIFPVEKELL